MTASVGPSPKVRKRSNTGLIEAMLASIASSVEQLARFVLAGRIADLGGAAAHQHDRLVPGLLQPAQQHDLDQAADMERRRGRVEADIAGHDLLRGERVEPAGIGDLVDIAALVEQAQEIGFVFGHGARRVASERGQALRSDPWTCRVLVAHPASCRATGRCAASSVIVVMRGCCGIASADFVVDRASRRLCRCLPRAPAARARRAVAAHLLRAVPARAGERRLSRVQFLALGRLGGLSASTAIDRAWRPTCGAAISRRRHRSGMTATSPVGIDARDRR